METGKRWSVWDVLLETTVTFGRFVKASFCGLRCGEVRCGSAGGVCPCRVVYGVARYVPVWQVRLGKALFGSLRYGCAWLVVAGTFRHCPVRYCRLRYVPSWFGRCGAVRRVCLGHGLVGSVAVRQVRLCEASNGALCCGMVGLGR